MSVKVSKTSKWRAMNQSSRAWTAYYTNMLKKIESEVDKELSEAVKNVR